MPARYIIRVATIISTRLSVGSARRGAYVSKPPSRVHARARERRRNEIESKVTKRFLANLPGHTRGERIDAGPGIVIFNDGTSPQRMRLLLPAGHNYIQGANKNLTLPEIKLY